MSAAYYASLNAARAALSEHHRHARTHGGRATSSASSSWTGRLDQRRAGEAAPLQKQREAADYEAVRPSPEDAAAAVAAAERFVAAVQALLTDG